MFFCAFPTPANIFSSRSYGEVIVGLLLLLTLCVIPARGDIIDTSFDAHLDTTTFQNDIASLVATLPNGKIVMSGGFNRYNGRSVGSFIRINPDGSLDNSFRTDVFEVGPSGEIHILPDGKLLIRGSFAFSGGTTLINSVIRLNENGTVDSTFSFEPTGWARQADIDANGRVLVLGNFQYVREGQTVARGLVRLNPDGTVDDSFNCLAPIDKFKTQGNKIVHFISEIGNGYQMRRQNEDGSPDNSFTQTALGNFAMSVFDEQSDHKLVLLRDTTVIRVNVDGGIDNTFQGATWVGNGGTPKMVVLDNDRIVVGHATATAPFGLKFIRLLSNGPLDPSFTSYLFTPAGNAAWDVHQDGSVMIGESGLDFAASTSVKLLPGGQVDTTYNAGNIGFQSIRPGKIRAIHVLSSNKILIGGDFDKVNTTLRPKIALLNPNSTLDASFQINTTPSGNYFSVLEDIYDIEVQDDGKLLVSGDFTYVISGVSRRNVVRLHQDGSIDPSFSLGLQINSYFTTSGLSTNKPVFRADGKIVVGNSKVLPADPLAPLQLLSNGSRDTSFNPTPFGTNEVMVFDLAVAGDKILIAGFWSRLESGTNVIRKGFVARLNLDGTIDNTFQVFEMLEKRFVSLRVLPSGKVLAIHRSDTDGEVYRLNSNGTPDESFNSGLGANGKLNAIAVIADGRIVVGGLFTSYNGQERRNLLVLGPDGDVLPRHIDTNKEVLCLSLDNNGRVLVGGSFTSLQAPGQGAVEISYLARINELSPVGKAPFDFDADGKTDVGIFRPSVGEWWIYRSSDATALAAQFGASTDKIVPADFTGDGKTDVAIWRPVTGEWFVLRSENNTYYSAPFGASTDIPAPADYDADGKADIAVYRPSTGYWFVNRSSDGNTTSTPFGGNPGDIPIPADYDGDGKADLAIYYVAGGEWWLNRSTAGLIVYQFGNSSDKLAHGDYTGDGKTDVAFWRPGTGEWFVLRSEDGSYYSAPFGASDDIPTPGDYDGDGKFDFTVFRPSSGMWFVNRSSGGTSATPWGTSGDLPVSRAFLP